MQSFSSRSDVSVCFSFSYLAAKSHIIRLDSIISVYTQCHCNCIYSTKCYLHNIRLGPFQLSCEQMRAKRPMYTRSLFNLYSRNNSNNNNDSNSEHQADNNENIVERTSTTSSSSSSVQRPQLVGKIGKCALSQRKWSLGRQTNVTGEHQTEKCVFCVECCTVHCVYTTRQATIKSTQAMFRKRGGNLCERKKKARTHTNSARTDAYRAENELGQHKNKKWHKKKRRKSTCRRSMAEDDWSVLYNLGVCSVSVCACV